MNNYQQSLELAGLSPEQAIIYSCLIENGQLPAGKISLKTPLKRGLVYKILDQLVEMGVIIKDEKPGKVATFEAAHPMKLNELAETKEKQAKNAQEVLKSILGPLTSDYNLKLSKPGIGYYVGAAGVEKIYDDILRTGQDVFLVRAVYEEKHAVGLHPITDAFIKKRVKAGIKVTALTPQDEFITEKRLAQDAERLLTRVIISKEMYNAPVEINIYGNKIALVSYGNELLGLIVESPQIAGAFRQLFNLLRLGALASQKK
jgi:sugar-specific transcriptional regulator TrmB